MFRVAVLLLVARWLDLHLLVMPAVTPEAPWSIGWQIPALLGAGALLLWAVDRALRAAPMLPSRDPFLEESLHHHT